MQINETIRIRGLVMHQTEGRSAPRFVCQLCGEFIEHAGLALLVWDPDGDEVLAAHKDCNAKDGDRFLCTQELGTTLMYLLLNSGIADENSLRKWVRTAASLSRF